MGCGEGEVVGVGQPAADLLAAIATFGQAFMPAADPAAIAAQMVHLRAGVDRLELAFAEAAGAFAATDEYEVQGAATPIEWVRHNTKMTGAAAAERVCVGQQLERLPLSAETLVAGKIGFGHLVYMARAARALTTSKTSAGFDEASLLPLAEEMSVGKFGFACHNYRHAQDPEGYAKDEVAAAQLRELTMTTGADGRLFIRGSFDPAGGAVVRTGLESLAKK